MHDDPSLCPAWLSDLAGFNFQWAVLSWAPVSTSFRLVLVSVSNPFLIFNAGGMRRSPDRYPQPKGACRAAEPD
ncbi:hypothetical protein MPLB_280033 [Mesorhizobium sp. ORS 3324]|nr:hypothetical protein MPLB_280033 [Mesorhizobium sp. ORS 3324]